jgi:hypothetical protein
MNYSEPVEIGCFTFEVKETFQRSGGIFVITEKSNPDWRLIATSANAVQAFLRGVMIGAEGKM